MCSGDESKRNNVPHTTSVSRVEPDWGGGVKCRE